MSNDLFVKVRSKLFWTTLFGTLCLRLTPKKPISYLQVQLTGCRVYNPKWFEKLKPLDV